jgi:uncharacterized protein (TIGR03437 family)
MMKHSFQRRGLLLVGALGALLVGTVGASAQMIATIAGDGASTYSGDGGLATAAGVNPRGVVVDGAGNIYIADIANSRVRKVTLSGSISTVAGSGVAGYSGDGGAAVTAMLSGPQAVALDASGNLVIADTQNRRIRSVNASTGIITTIAGTGVQGFSGDGGLATAAMVWQPVDLAVDAAGNIYFADSSAQRVRKISTNGIITTVAGNGTAGYGGDNAAGPLAQLNFPVGVAVDTNNLVYIADANNFRVRVVNPAGTIVTIAGNGTEGFSGDGGAATSATLNYPEGVRVNAAGQIYIADAENNRVRVVTSGNISTLTGDGVNGFSGDGGLAVNAVLNTPWSVALDPSGNLLIGDSVNNRVRKVTLAALAPPTLAANGTVNAASYTPATSANGAIAPGSIVAIFGTNLASTAAAAASLPLPTTLATTTVTMNGVAVPLFYIAGGQVNAQAPFNLPSGSVSIQATVGSQTTLVQTAQVVSALPGVFTTNSAGTGAGIFLHASYLPVTAASPAVPGETILIYCTGLGATNPAVATGSASPSNPAATSIVAPTVTIGGQSAVVSFAGLAPTFVGLNQINVQVPMSLLAGTQQVIVQMNGVSGNATTLPVN